MNADNSNFPSITSEFGFKIGRSSNGTYTLTQPPGELTGGAPSDSANSATISNSDGTIFDWSATLGIDAVIVKGGPNANAYVYTPEAFGDSGLHAPDHPSPGQIPTVSHIEFCYDYELTVTKTANASFTRTFNGTIDKSVDPQTWGLFTGDSGTSEYTVDITKTGFTDSNWAVEGTITINNPALVAVSITGVSDVVSPDIAAAVDCGVTFPHALAAGGTLVCTYSTALPNGSNRTNTATVTTSGAVGGGEATADVIFGDPTTVVDGTINVTDTFAGALGSFSDSGSVSYERTFTCDGDEGTHDNTATIDETGQSDGASVTVNCYALEVTKDAHTSFTCTWRWAVDKSADQTEITLSPGQTFTVNYEVTVDATSTESDHAVSGSIWVANPNPVLDAILTDVSDVVSPDIAAGVDCPSLTVPAEDSLHCTYSADLPDDSDRSNGATATLQSHDFDPDGEGTPSGTTDFSGSADVDFSTATVNKIDECVDVSDTYAGFLGTVCAGDAPHTFEYSRLIGPFEDPEDCGENEVTKTASFEAEDTQAAGEDSWTVLVTVPCDFGCTLTPGYWKTHSEFGPAPFDDTWDLILPVGQDTTFFQSGASYYNVLWTAPQGNAYYIPAHAYIAAELNQLNGADFTDAQAAFEQATTLFNTYTPAEIAGLKGNDPVCKSFVKLAAILDAYNNGLTGPGHCSE